MTKSPLWEQKPSALWHLGRAERAELLAAGKTVQLKARPDQASLFLPLFERAQALQDKGTTIDRATIKRFLDDYQKQGSLLEENSAAMTDAHQSAPKEYEAVEHPSAPCNKSDAVAECDRRAIRAMAGDFAVRFQFNET